MHGEGVVVVVQMMVVVMVGVVGRRLVGPHGGGGCAEAAGGGRGEGLTQHRDGVGVGEKDVGAAAQRLRIGLAREESGPAGGKRQGGIAAPVHVVEARCDAGAQGGGGIFFRVL